MHLTQRGRFIGLLVCLIGFEGPCATTDAAEAGAAVEAGVAEPLELEPEAKPAVPPPPAKPAAKPFVLPAGVKLAANLSYGENGEANLLDIYSPEKTAGPLPLVIWVHGGGWANGDKGPSPQFLQLVPLGFAVASINYRLSGQAPFPAQIEDCKAAVRWLRAHAAEHGLDPERFGAWGHSAGGHLVALLGTSGGVEKLEGTVGGNLGVSSRVQAVSDYAGPTDISKFWTQAGPENVFWQMKGSSYFDRLFGEGPFEDHPDLVRLANPIEYVSADDPPFQIFHGVKDVLVPVGQAELLVAALEAKGVACEYTPLPTMGHGFGQLQYRETFKFFQKHLQPQGSAAATSAAPR